MFCNVSRTISFGDHQARHKLFQVLIGQVAKDREINAVFSKTVCILGHAEVFEPVPNLLHRSLPE